MGGRCSSNRTSTTLPRTEITMPGFDQTALFSVCSSSGEADSFRDAAADERCIYSLSYIAGRLRTIAPPVAMRRRCCTWKQPIRLDAVGRAAANLAAFSQHFIRHFGDSLGRTKRLTSDQPWSSDQRRSEITPGATLPGFSRIRTNLFPFIAGRSAQFRRWVITTLMR